MATNVVDNAIKGCGMRFAEVELEPGEAADIQYVGKVKTALFGGELDPGRPRHTVEPAEAAAARRGAHAQCVGAPTGDEIHALLQVLITRLMKRLLSEPDA